MKFYFMFYCSSVRIYAFINVAAPPKHVFINQSQHRKESFQGSRKGEKTETLN